jgi:organic hydroperoxide reductase OsmC/OhrA
MMGTLAGLLAKSGIPTPSDCYVARVEGHVEDVDGILRITKIHVAYDLKVPRGKTQAAREALAVYQIRCPAAASVRNCIEITDWANITEYEDVKTART